MRKITAGIAMAVMKIIPVSVSQLQRGGRDGRRAGGVWASGRERRRAGVGVGGVDEMGVAPVVLRDLLRGGDGVGRKSLLIDGSLKSASGVAGGTVEEDGGKVSGTRLSGTTNGEVRGWAFSAVKRVSDWSDSATSRALAKR